jgi:hypothetical protein
LVVRGVAPNHFAVAVEVAFREEVEEGIDVERLVVITVHGSHFSLGFGFGLIVVIAFPRPLTGAAALRKRRLATRLNDELITDRWWLTAADNKRQGSLQVVGLAEEDGPQMEVLELEVVRFVLLVI